MKSLGNELIYPYDINVKKYQYLRSNYYLDTNKGKLVLRKMNITKDQVLFGYEATSFLVEDNFLDIPEIYLTKKKLPYVTHQDKVYMLQQFRGGEEIDFKEEENLVGAIKLLASFHIHGRDFSASGRKIRPESIKNIYDYYQKRYTETKKAKKTIAELANKPTFERMFLDEYRNYQLLEQMAVEQLEEKNSLLLMEKAIQNKTIIHNDYSYHAIHKEEKGKYYISNIDSCTYNIQLLDLAHVLTRIMQKNNWDIELLKLLVEHYNSICPLSLEELKVLKALLIFPEKFANICHQYLQTKHRGNYNMFEVKWKNMREYLEEQQNTAEKIICFL